MKAIRFAVLLLWPAIFNGCFYDKADLLYPGTNIDCTTITARFADVSPVIAGKCATAGCHNSTSAAGGTILETFDQVRAKAGLINQRVLIDRTMPPGMVLSVNEMALLKCWISSGAPN